MSTLTEQVLDLNSSGKEEHSNKLALMKGKQEEASQLVNQSYLDREMSFLFCKWARKKPSYHEKTPATC